MRAGERGLLWLARRGRAHAMLGLHHSTHGTHGTWGRAHAMLGLHHSTHGTCTTHGGGRTPCSAYTTAQHTRHMHHTAHAPHMGAFPRTCTTHGGGRTVLLAVRGNARQVSNAVLNVEEGVVAHDGVVFKPGNVHLHQRTTIKGIVD